MGDMFRPRLGHYQALRGTIALSTQIFVIVMDRSKEWVLKARCQRYRAARWRKQSPLHVL